MKPRTTLLALLALIAASVPVDAQVIGPFTWQTQPYCNVITLTAIQYGGFYQLTGTDDLCGTGTAPITGTAAPSAGGVTLGFTVAFPSGGATHISATIDLGTFSGSWSDGVGNSGTFVFGGSSAGAQRPAPPGILASFAITGGNGEGVGGTICTSPNGLEIFIKNAHGDPVDARFSFVVPEFAFGQIRSGGSIRSSSANLLSVEHPSPGAYCLVFSSAPPFPEKEATVVSIHAEQ